MSTTQYLGLNKPSGNDLVNPLTDTFPNWDIVDESYHELDIRALGRATELVSQGVHAITIIDTDCKTIKWTATANFTAGDTFTVNGIQCNAYLPSGEALGTNAYITGAQVIASLNDDNSAMTVYVPQGAVAVASDSERLGGELPSYYATKSYADGIKSTADSASQLIQRKALVNTYYDSSSKKLYQVNADGSQGGEIEMCMPSLNYNNPLHTSTDSATTFTANKTCYAIGGGDLKSSGQVTVNGKPLMGGYTSSGNNSTIVLPLIKLTAGDTITFPAIASGRGGFGVFETK